MSFRSEDDFYFLQILQRKKENELLDSNSRVIKNYYINSTESLLNQYDEIKKLCRMFNARASLRLNRRSYEKIAFQNLLAVTNTVMNKDFKFIKRTYDRTCGQFNSEDRKIWILDVDNKALDVKRLKAAVMFCEPNEGEEKHIAVLPTKSGYHLLTYPFNVEQFKRTSRIDLDVHKDNPVNLFIP